MSCRRALALGLRGVLVHWNSLAHKPWLTRRIELEEAERKRRNYERRLRDTQLTATKPLVEFDQGLIQEIFALHFPTAAPSPLEQAEQSRRARDPALEQKIRDTMLGVLHEAKVPPEFYRGQPRARRRRAPRTSAAREPVR